MNLKVILLVVMFLSSVSFYGCGRKDSPIKPSQIITKD